MPTDTADLKDVVKNIIIQHGRLAEVETMIKSLESRRKVIQHSIEFLQDRRKALELVETSKVPMDGAAKGSGRQ